MVKHSPIDYLLEHAFIVLPVYRKNDRKPKRTWESLLKQLPELSEAMSAATFRQYITVFAAIFEGLDKVRQDGEKARRSTNTLEAENRSLQVRLQNRQQELDKVRQDLETLSRKPRRSINSSQSVEDAPDRPPKRVAGWNLRRSKDGYLRCYRRINAKLHSIYLGKSFDLDRTERLIAEKEKKIGLDRS
ncbi:MAG: hypothetical protein GY867_09490 [bacterium]|nr:hypothetical protein [bacterium]